MEKGAINRVGLAEGLFRRALLGEPEPGANRVVRLIRQPGLEGCRIGKGQQWKLIVHHTPLIASSRRACWGLLERPHQACWRLITGPETPGRGRARRAATVGRSRPFAALSSLGSPSGWSGRMSCSGEIPASVLLADKSTSRPVR